MQYLLQYSTKLFKKAQQDLGKSTISPNEENLHELRVSIKKINALLNYLSYCYLEKFAPGKLHKLFHRTGRIRELQLMIGDFSDHFEKHPKGKAALMKQLGKKMTKRVEGFTRRYRNEKLLFSKLTNDVKECVVRIPSKTPAQYFEHMEHLILAAAAHPTNDEQEVHQLRKDIKTLKYNIAWQPGVVKTKIPMDDWEQILGEWHDAMDKASLIKKFRKSAANSLQRTLKHFQHSYRHRERKKLGKFEKEAADFRTQQ